MADGEHMLPADEELFEQPVHEDGDQVGEMQQEPHLGEQEPQHEQLIEQHDDIQQIEEPEVNVDEITEPDDVPVENEPVAPRGIPFLDDPPAAMPMPDLYQEPIHNYYQPPPQEEIVAPVRIRNNELFQPAAYVPYVEQRRGSEEYSDGGADGENGPDNDPARLDANEATVWIDSDSDNDTEEAILKQNFYLPYSDHNYDCADPLDRVNHPQEGPFPIIDGLDTHGNIVKQYMPGQDPPATPPPQDRSLSPGTSSAILQQDISHHQVIHQHHQMPHRQVLHMNRPVGTTPPFSVGGSEYQQQRVEPMQRVSRDGNFRIINSDYGMPQRPQTQRVLPNTSTIIRQSGAQAIYQSPQQAQTPLGTVRTMNPMQRRPLPHQNPAPGSYQHIQQPIPGASGVMRRPIGRVPQQLVGNRQATVRPMQVGRPMEVHERDYIESLQPAQSVAAPAPPPPPPVQRRVADVAPHRMTQEQIQHQQQLVRQRPAAQFPVSEPQSGSPTAQAQIVPANRLGANRMFVRGQGQAPAGAGVLVRARGISGTEDLLRSPQRLPSQSPQRANESPRKFQLKVSEATYSAPIPKISDQLPAQITEDPPEDEPTSSAAAAAAMDAIHEDGPPAQLLEEESVPSRHASPIKPTPPHRMTQDEKHAHLARLAADKEKPVISSPVHQSSAPQHLVKPSVEVPPSSAPLPLRPGHQDDTLAMVQSVFDSSKPRLPDTPKDKEAILKIADHLRFSAEKYEINKIPDSVRRRNDSQMSQGSQSHGHGYHHDPLAMERDDGRRKRQSLTRYDMQHPQHPHQSSSSSIRPQHPPHQQQHMEQLEPPHRSRGRPRGSIGPQRTRGNEPIAPHRVGGGARTLPPRSQAPPVRNGGADNSDSESEGIDEESWVMRCHCGMSHPTGLSVECEQCKTWQHTYCMGLKSNTNTDGYLCEQCKPRRLSVTKQEAIKIQKRELAKTKKENKKKKEKKERKERRSEPPPELPPKKSIASSSSSTRKSAPHYREPEPVKPKIPQLNEYSKAAAQLLASLPRTQGAEQLLEDARESNKAKRMFVSENVEALVTTDAINVRAVLIEMTGHISMSNEVKRQPGGGGHIFLYDGLMKDASGSDTGETQELIAVDTRRRGNDTKLTRRSCVPNCVLKHVLGADVLLGVMLVATKEIPYNQEVTLPFDQDWIDNDQPLECAEHLNDMGLCPFEQRRREECRHRTYLRQKKEDEKRRQQQLERDRIIEQRRLEDEVRRDREEKMRKLGEEEDRKKREERADLEAKKKQERDEAKKRRESEKAARQGSEEHKQEETKSEPHKLSRDERLTQQAEERFRRQEKEAQRKEEQKAKALEKAEARKSKSKTPEVEDPNAPESSSAAQKRDQHLSKSDEEVKISSTDDDKRGTKRNDSAQRTASPPAKRPRSSTARVPMPTERVSTMKASTPSSKKQKKDDSQIKVRAFADCFQANAKEAIKQREVFVLPESISENESDWVADRTKNIKRNISSNTALVAEALAKKTRKLEAIDRERDEQAEARERERKKMQEKTDKLAAAIEQEKKDAAEKKKRKEEAEKAQQAGPAPVVPALTPVPELPVDEPMEIDEPEPQRDETPAKSETSGSKGSREPSEAKEVRESRESSETKESGPKKGGAGPKKLSLEQYKQKRAVANKEEASTSGTPVSAPPRQCFIPSTDASSTANATLSNIFLDGFLPGTSSSASEPSTSAVSKTVETVASLSEEEPTHTQSLADRAAAVFGLNLLQASSSSSSSSSASRPHETRVRQRSSRWNQI